MKCMILSKWVENILLHLFGAHSITTNSEPDKPSLNNNFINFQPWSWIEVWPLPTSPTIILFPMEALEVEADASTHSSITFIPLSSFNLHSSFFTSPHHQMPLVHDGRQNHQIQSYLPARSVAVACGSKTGDLDFVYFGAHHDLGSPDVIENGYFFGIRLSILLDRLESFGGPGSWFRALMLRWRLFGGERIVKLSLCRNSSGSLPLFLIVLRLFFSTGLGLALLKLQR